MYIHMCTVTQLIHNYCALCIQLIYSNMNRPNPACNNFTICREAKEIHHQNKTKWKYDMKIIFGHSYGKHFIPQEDSCEADPMSGEM